MRRDVWLLNQNKWQSLHCKSFSAEAANMVIQLHKSNISVAKLRCCEIQILNLSSESSLFHASSALPPSPLCCGWRGPPQCLAWLFLDKQVKNTMAGTKVARVEKIGKAHASRLPLELRWWMAPISKLYTCTVSKCVASTQLLHNFCTSSTFMEKLVQLLGTDVEKLQPHSRWAALYK